MQLYRAAAVFPCASRPSSRGGVGLPNPDPKLFRLQLGQRAKQFLDAWLCNAARDFALGLLDPKPRDFRHRHVDGTPISAVRLTNGTGLPRSPDWTGRALPVGAAASAYGALP
jgi:hypothetical protein